MKHERLLYLGVVEEVAEALRCDLRMIGKHDRGSEDRIVIGRCQDREGVETRRRLDCGPGRAATLKRRDEPAAVGFDDDMSREHAGDERLRSLHLGRHVRLQLGRVVNAGADAKEPVAERLAAHANTTAHRLFAGELELRADPLRCELGQRRRRKLDPALGGLVALARGLQEEKGGGQAGLALDLEHAFEAQMIVSRDVERRIGGRIDDPERRRGRVLGRSRGVGIEGVSLIEKRGDEGRHLLVHGAQDSFASSRSSSSCSTAASNVGRPRSVLSSCRRSIVAVSSGIQPR